MGILARVRTPRHVGLQPQEARRAFPDKPLRLGLVGCGRVAALGYVPAARRLPAVRLVAVADTELSRCREGAPGVASFASAAGLIESGMAEALVLATPAAAHLPDARLAAAAGLPALVEKPPALDAVEAAALVALDPAPWVGFNRRFEPSLERVRAAVRGRERLKLWLELSYRRDSWKPFVVADDAITDLGPHLIDLARWLTGSEVEGVRAELAPRRAILELDLGGGSLARVVCLTDRPYRERVEIRNCRGSTIASHVNGGLARGLLARLRAPSGHTLVQSLALQLEAFARAARGGPAPLLATARDGLAVMEAIDAARAFGARR